MARLLPSRRTGRGSAASALSVDPFGEGPGQPSTLQQVLTTPPVSTALYVLSTPGAIVRSGLKELGDLLDDRKRAEITGAYGRKFNSTASLSDFLRQSFVSDERITGGDLIEFINQSSLLSGRMSRPVRAALGFGADLATDPFAYTRVGAIGNLSRSINFQDEAVRVVREGALRGLPRESVSRIGAEIYTGGRAGLRKAAEAGLVNYRPGLFLALPGGKSFRVRGADKVGVAAERVFSGLRQASQEFLSEVPLPGRRSGELRRAAVSEVRGGPGGGFVEALVSSQVRATMNTVQNRVAARMQSQIASDFTALGGREALEEAVAVDKSRLAPMIEAHLARGRALAAAHGVEDMEPIRPRVGRIFGESKPSFGTTAIKDAEDRLLKAVEKATRGSDVLEALNLYSYDIGRQIGLKEALVNNRAMVRFADLTRDIEEPKKLLDKIIDLDARLANLDRDSKKLARQEERVFERAVTALPVDLTALDDATEQLQVAARRVEQLVEQAEEAKKPSPAVAALEQYLSTIADTGQAMIVAGQVLNDPNIVQDGLRLQQPFRQWLQQRKTPDDPVPSSQRLIPGFVPEQLAKGTVELGDDVTAKKLLRRIASGTESEAVRTVLGRSQQAGPFTLTPVGDLRAALRRVAIGEEEAGDSDLLTVVGIDVKSVRKAGRLLASNPVEPNISALTTRVSNLQQVLQIASTSEGQQKIRKQLEYIRDRLLGGNVTPDQRASLKDMQKLLTASLTDSGRKGLQAEITRHRSVINDAKAKFEKLAAQTDGTVERLAGLLHGEDMLRTAAASVDVQALLDEAYGAINLLRSVLNADTAALQGPRVRELEQAVEQAVETLYDTGNRLLQTEGEVAQQVLDQVNLLRSNISAYFAPLRGSIANQTQDAIIEQSLLTVELKSRLVEEYGVDPNTVMREAADADAAFIQALITLEGLGWKRVGSQLINRRLAEATNPTFGWAPRNKFSRILRETTKIWRELALLRPGFSNRNYAGAVLNNWLEERVTPRWYREMALLQKQMRKAAETGTESELIERWRQDPVLSRLADVLPGDAFIGAGVERDIKVLARAPKLAGLGQQAGQFFENYAPLKILIARASRNVAVEDNVRGALYLKLVKDRNLHPDVAVDIVNRIHFDYNDLTRWERVIRDVAVPFWTFRAKNLPLAAQLMVRRPELRQLWVNATRTVQQHDKQGTLGNPPPGLVGGITGALGEGLFVTATNWLPAADTTDLAQGIIENLDDPIGLARVGLQQTGGGHRMLFELTSGRQLFNSRPIVKPDEGPPINQIARYFVGQIGPASSAALALDPPKSTINPWLTILDRHLGMIPRSSRFRG